MSSSLQASLHEFFDETTPPRDGVPVVEREAVQCIVRHPTKELFLLLKKLAWETESWSFPTGGVEPDETPILSAARETEEETGYADRAELEEVSSPYWVNFYHEVKKVNRRARMHTCSTRLRSMAQQEITPEEAALHEIHWLPAEEVLQKVHGEGAKLAFREYLEHQQAAPTKM